MALSRQTIEQLPYTKEDGLEMAVNFTLSRTTGGRPAGLNTSGMDAVVLEHTRNSTEFGSHPEPPVKILVEFRCFKT